MTLAAGAIVLAAGIAATLSHTSVRRTGTDDVVVTSVVDRLRGAHRLCQDGELVPAGTAALELTGTGHGARALDVELLDAATEAPVASGTTGAWRAADATVTARLRPQIARERTVRVCVELHAPSADATASLYGGAAQAQGATDDGQRLGGRIRLDYLGAGSPSWASFAPTVVARLGRAHAWSGTTVAVVAALLTLISISLAAWLLVRTS